MDILKRTPLKEVLHCRRVCKNLLSLISDPYFTQTLVARTPFRGFVYHSYYQSTDLNFVKLDGHEYRAFAYESTVRKPVDAPFLAGGDYVKLVGSANGLLCLWSQFSVVNSCPETLYISNPVLGEFAAIPNPGPPDSVYPFFNFYEETYGFHFIPATGQFVVIRFVLLLMKCQIQVLIVGTDSWRCVADAPRPLSKKIIKVLLNGCLHWIVESGDSFAFYSFDIEKERGRPIPAPSGLSDNVRSMKLGVLGSNLCLFNFCDAAKIEIWSMREYGVAASWTKVCVSYTYRLSPPPRCVIVWYDLGIMVSCNGGQLVPYVPEEEENAETYGFHDNSRYEAEYTPSFVSLTHLYKGAGSKIKNVKSWPA